MEDTPHLLAEIEKEIYLEPASKGARLLNYIIDIISFYAIVFILSFLMALFIPFESIRTIQQSQESNSGGGVVQLALLFAFIFTFFAYYILMEGFTKGRTIGKFITGTQAVSVDGSHITFKQVLIRSITRLVPFEPFSALGYIPWHDSWAGTIVIKKK